VDGGRIIFLSPVESFVLRLSGSDNGTARDELTWIAGSVVLSDNPPLQLKHWRKKFGVKQADLAKKMAITPSVLSDYEKGRRPSPGANFIKRYLQSLYDLAQANGKDEKAVAEMTPIAPDAVSINQS
jgi:putative transcriptional regulator